MKDFNSYIPDDKPKNEGGKSIKDVPKSAVDMVKNLAKKFHGKDQSELVAQIIKEAEKGRSDGSLTDDELDRFASIVTPFIDGEKRQKLDEIINKLKKS